MLSWAERTCSPPATSTRPSVRTVAEWPCRGTAIAPVGVQAPLTGSYTSAEVSPGTGQT